MKRRERARIPESVKLVTPWLAFLILFILPLYIITATIVIRTNLFQFNSKTISEEQIKALWAFVAAGLGAAATITGALLTYQHNRRTQAIQDQTDALKRQREDEAIARDEKAQQDKQRLDEQAAARMTLETVVKGLELITQDGDYAPQARIAGALVTMVQLKQEVVAMRILGVLWKDHKVDNDTAAWLISQVLLTHTDSESVEEAAALLLMHASELTDSENRGFLSWPNLPNDWVTQFSFQAKASLLISLTKLLVSQDRSWWEEGDYTWIYPILTQALDDEDWNVANYAAILMQPLIEDYRVAGFSDVGHAENRVAELTRGQREAPERMVRDQVEALQNWVSEGKAQVQPTRSANMPIISGTTGGASQ